ncbi:hypothetical protein N7509_007124 [Penicillium cosmopolitanum]|uniref:Uncharacterized protein n=1 Tax=Penicillium cosmopolitanum TaxID=1131564 RepID=A0A9W9VYE3_9EURO|nr:uncharacterized protein N7509_007124 [Penicillium cosmopolitanum]KAJ5391634.1 hypothetical protein N7509_007124 [Penicillium cosmopolitanum]
MLSLVKTVSLVGVFATAIAQDVFTINTPSTLVSTLLTWSGGVAPYSLSVKGGGNAAGPSLEDLGSQDDTSYEWKVDQQASTTLSDTR